MTRDDARAVWNRLDEAGIRVSLDRSARGFTPDGEEEYVVALNAGELTPADLRLVADEAKCRATIRIDVGGLTLR